MLILNIVSGQIMISKDENVIWFKFNWFDINFKNSPCTNEYWEGYILNRTVNMFSYNFILIWKSPLFNGF